MTARTLHNKNSIKAFTLIEIVITAVILVIAIVPMLSTLFEHYRATADIVSKVTAANYAKDVIDYLKSLPYEKLDNSFNETETGGAGESQNYKMLPPLAKGFFREVSITEYNDEEIGTGRKEKFDYKIIRVNVTIDDGSGKKTDGTKLSLVGSVIAKKLEKSSKK